MNTYTQAQINALVSAGIDLNEFFGATTAPVQAHVADPKPAKREKAQPQAQVLTRARWNTLRKTKAGVTRKAFVGLTREQAHAKGLTPGYVLPTGAMREALGA